MQDQDAELMHHAHVLAESGRYLSFAQIGVALEADGFAGALRRLGANDNLKHQLNRICAAARGSAA